MKQVVIQGFILNSTTENGILDSVKVDFQKEDGTIGKVSINITELFIEIWDKIKNTL